MAYVPLIRVFLSSPGDVAEERAIARKIMKRLPNRPSFKERVVLNVVAWDDLDSSTAMEASLSPQLAINKGLPTPAECEIVIVLFWSRMGTPFTDVDEKRYQSGTHWELLNALSSAKTQSYIYRRTKSPSISMDDANFDERFKQYQRVKDFFNSELFFKEGEIKKSVHHYENPADFEELFDRHFEEIISRVLAAIENEKPEPKAILPEKPEIEIIESLIWPDGKSPFPGLRAFHEADADIFFGRGHETDALVQQVKASRFVAVVGASGSGKSSLVGAGLIPRLHANAIIGSKDWKIARFTPGEQPFEQLYEALLEIFPQFQPNEMEARRVKQNFVADMREAPESLLTICKKGLASMPEWAEVMLFIDQFEELFTLTSAADAKIFTDLLGQITQSKHMRLVLTIRHDFFNKAVENQILSELLRADAVFSLAIPKRDALRQMIERPAERAGLEIELGLVEAILDDTGDEPGNLALMAYTLDELYKSAKAKSLSKKDYAGLGGVHGAIGKRAEAVFQALAGAESDKGAVLKVLFHALVSVSEDGTPTRQRISYNAEKAEPAIRQLVEALTKARLLTQDGDTPRHEGEGQGVRVTLEVAHEALFRSWERLKNWIAEAQEDLILLRQVKNAAQEWEAKKRPEFLLWPQERLVLVYAIQKRLNPQLTEQEKPIVEAFIEPEQQRLLRELEILETIHERRRDIGDRLAVIGDNRIGVGLDENGLPDIAWLPVDGSNGKIFPFKDNIGTVFGEFEVKPFYVAKYLVTYVQYQAFVEAEDGYNNPQWWQKFPENYRPQVLSQARGKMVNAARDSISWYQSMAFAAWFNHRLAGFAVAENLIVGKTAEIRLPTEWEWQWLAQNGTEKREYPWGSWKEGYANTSESGLSRTTSVGMYPQGAAVCGALDIAGNLQEWCLNDYENPDILYNYNNGKNKVLRGSAFVNANVMARSLYRHRNNPLAYSNLGCRLVLAPTASLPSRSETK